MPDKGINLIGKVLFRGEEKNIVFASRNDRRRHFYTVGQTGTGKSSLLRELIRQDIENGEGVAVIDPHGELIEHALAVVPKERAEDVVLFEPSDTERPTGLNMLEYDTPEQKDFAVQPKSDLPYNIVFFLCFHTVCKLDINFHFQKELLTPRAHWPNS